MMKMIKKEEKDFSCKLWLKYNHSLYFFESIEFLKISSKHFKETDIKYVSLLPILLYLKVRVL